MEDSEGNPMSCSINLFPSGRATVNPMPAPVVELLGQSFFFSVGLTGMADFFFYMGARDLNLGPYSSTEKCSYPLSQFPVLLLFTSSIPYQ